MSGGPSGVKGGEVKIPLKEIKNSEASSLLPSDVSDKDYAFCDGNLFIVSKVNGNSRVLELKTGELYEWRQVPGSNVQGELEFCMIGHVGERIVDAAIKIYEDEIGGGERV